MLNAHDKVLAAVSGGPDSIAMVLGLMALKNKYQITVGIAHLNHVLRKNEANKDEAFVRHFASQHDLPYHIRKRDVKSFAKAYRLSLEDAGRQLRYTLFNEVSDRYGYAKIATGHHKNDNAELVLMNLLRGAGPTGLSGIPAVRGKRIIRPLIEISKKQILSFLEDNHQAYVMDSSNRDNTFLRNRIRNYLIPFLQSEFNPEVTDALNRLSHILKQEDAYMKQTAHKAFKQCVSKWDAHSISFSTAALMNLDPAVFNRVIRMGLKKIKKNLRRISLTHIDDIYQFCMFSSQNGSLDLPNQIRVYKKNQQFIIKKEVLPLREIGKK